MFFIYYNNLYQFFFKLIKNNLKVLSMKTSYIFLITSIFLLFSCCPYDHLDSVQNGYWYACPDATNKELIDNVISNANWEAIVAEDGKNYVNVKGISNSGETEGKEIFFQFSSDELNEEFAISAFGVDENNDGEYSDSELLEMYSEDIVANLCAEYGLSYDDGAYYEDDSSDFETEEERRVAKIKAEAKKRGAIDIVDYQVDFSQGKKVKVFGMVAGMSIDLMFLYQLPEGMPFITMDLDQLSKENKKKILSCGEGCVATISGEMTSTDEVLVLDIIDIKTASQLQNY